MTEDPVPEDVEGTLDDRVRRQDQELFELRARVNDLERDMERIWGVRPELKRVEKGRY